MSPQGLGMGCPRSIYLICGLLAAAATVGAGFRVCRGTQYHLSHEFHEGGSQKRFDTLRTTYTNCTFVDGNLEVAFLTEKDNYDLSFLSSIKEVTGYVLIFSVYADYVPLTNLRIIRGDTLFSINNKDYGLYISKNYKPGSRIVGLKELRFTALHEIMDGDVGIHDNLQLCHNSDVNWYDIMTGEHAQFHVMMMGTEPRRDCNKCHPQCTINIDGYQHKGERHCWGEGPDMCQHLTREICSNQCEGRCFGEFPNQCCHPQCAAGCTGPTKYDCWACANFYSNGSCIPYCPKPFIYDEKEYKNIPNPEVKYAYGTLCVDKCPSYLMQEDASCVKECSFGMQNINGVCEVCDGPCPKSCLGMGREDFLNANNTDNFTGCTQVKGNIVIVPTTFDGDEHNSIPAMHPSRLAVLQDIQEISGFLKIQGKHDNFTNLDFLGNLRVINGRHVDEVGASLHIYDSSLKSMELRSLREIQYGMILVALNQHLCYAKSINWYNLRTNDDQRINVQQNRPYNECLADGFICDPQCSSEGCWGPGPENCLDCLNFKLGETCLESCDPVHMFQSGPKQCQYCHEECRDTCHGPGPGNCTVCKHAKDGPYCKSECPDLKYLDRNGECQLCNENCVSGCTGPNNTIGPGACNACAVAEMAPDEVNVTKCLPADTTTCDSGFFYGQVLTTYLSPMAGKPACIPCHQLCDTCNGPGISFCQTCRYYTWENRCVLDCNVKINMYRDEKTKTCEDCNQQCQGCTGPTSLDCEQCAMVKVYVTTSEEEDSPKQKVFNCTSQCPSHLPVRENSMVNGTSERLCVAKTAGVTGQPKGLHVIVGMVTGTCIIIAIVVIILTVCWRQRARARENALKLTARMSGLEESEPLTPTDARPDMSMLRLIKESELRKGNIIGSGAFGTVYKGVWIPEGENVKIPVAIKVLQEGTSPSLNKELLEEARVMASVDHPCCVRILAVCMTAQMMLITQLMPLGCLLDYVRKHKVNIGSKALLNWCTQIAKGMAYLEEKGVVHRDLAARNVLVQSPGQVKITDFGLAKLLDYNEEEYRSAGGKMPIKWLALECIQHRIFTHKSDVWSFGVTAWELFTYGQRPYENVRARDVPDLLEKGERLPQPSICTIDVYMIMIKCWMLDAESRPNFRELAEEFAKMARDPGRYLVIQGDKLLRLPSHTFDTKDLIRSMSVAADGPEEVMDAEDYLQPQAHIPETEPTIPNGRLDKVDDHSYMRHERNYDDDHHFASRDSAREREHRRRDKTYSGLEAAAKRKLQTPSRDSVSSRYSADPCKVPATGKEDGDTVELPPAPPPPPSSSDSILNGHEDPSSKPTSITIDQLPIDEDDYLQPKSSNPAAYMDLIEGKDYLNSEETESEPKDAIPQYLDIAPAPVSAIDNPVYFDKLEPIPEVTVRDPLSVEDLKTNNDPLRDRSLSTESSDPEYYNEYDKLNKDPKPVLFLNSRAESSV